MATWDALMGRRTVWLIALSAWLPSCSREAPPSQEAFFFVNHVEASPATFDRASLPTLYDEGTLSAAVTLDDDTRVCLAPPVDAPLSFAVELPQQPILRFAIATSTLARPRFQSPVVFKIVLQDENGQETVFREAMERRQRNRWLDREVSLAPWAGSNVRMTFQTTSLASNEEDSEGLFPLWANPVVARGDNGGRPSKMILISVDCLRADHVGVYGYDRATTPHIDRFADDGVVFETATSTSASTLPTHMSMLTGMPPSLHGVSKWQKLASPTPYLSELLRGASYQVDAVVSGAYLAQTFGFHRGFHSYRYLAHHRASDAVDTALDLLRRATGQDQFLFLHIIDAHWPYKPEPELVAPFRATMPDVDALAAKLLNREPPDGPAEIQQVMDLYDAEVASVDREIGRFLEELRAMELYDETLIILTGDHGEAFYEHGKWQHTIALYEEVIHIPLIVKWPGSSIKGRVATPVSQADIFTTLLEQAGVPPPHSESISLLRQAKGAPPPNRHSFLVSEFATRPAPESGAVKVVSLRTDELKYIATFTTTPESLLTIDEMLEEELYNLSLDPGETRNLLDETPHPDITAFHSELHAYLEKARELEGDRRGDGVILDETTRKRLEGLGYLNPQ